MNTQDPQYPKDPKQSSKKVPGEGPEPFASSSNQPGKTYPSEASHSYENDSTKDSYQSSSSSSKTYTNEHLDAIGIPGEKKNYDNFSQKEKTSEKTDPKTKVDDLYTYAKSNREQTITYILLILGLILLLMFNSLLGELIIGMVAGYYFAPEIIYYFRHIDEIFKSQNQTRHIVLIALLLSLFIAAPGIVIGAAIVAAFKQVMRV